MAHFPAPQSCTGGEGVQERERKRERERQRESAHVSSILFGDKKYNLTVFNNQKTATHLDRVGSVICNGFRV